MTDEPDRPTDDGAPRRTRIVVATEDVAAAKMAGPAIRAWNLADSLSHEHDGV